jgi:hypothetical protein
MGVVVMVRVIPELGMLRWVTAAGLEGLNGAAVQAVPAKHRGVGPGKAGWEAGQLVNMERLLVVWGWLGS